MSIAVEKTDLSLKYVSHFNEIKDQLHNSSPGLLNLHRNRAFQEFVKNGIPTRKNENYKYTNLNPAFQPDYRIVNSREEIQASKRDLFRCDVPQLNINLTLLNNGWFYEKNHENQALPKGVILDSLEKAADSHPEIIKKYYAVLTETGDDSIISLNTAFAQDGYFLYVPANVQLKDAIQIVNLLKSDDDAFVTQRNLIVVEPGAHAQIIICDHTLDKNRYFSNTVTEIFVGENASFEYYAVQNQHNQSNSVNTVFVKQEQNSVVRSNVVSLHGGLIRNNLKFLLNGNNAEANMFGMAFLDKNQHVDNFTQVIHAKPHCQSNQIYKYVLDEKSTGAFSGRIHVARDAQKTNAFQRNNNLLLTDTASMQTKPQLIIDADDVKCSHGATVGQIDEQALFYLRARGINEDIARMMMMNAFAHEVIQEIKVEALRDRMDELIEKRLKGEIARCHECEYNCD